MICGKKPKRSTVVRHPNHSLRHAARSRDAGNAINPQVNGQVSSDAPSHAAATSSGIWAYYAYITGVDWS